MTSRLVARHESCRSCLRPNTDRNTSSTNRTKGRLMPKESVSGHLYVQTSTIHNAVIHFLRASDGTLTEADRVLTGGAGSGPFNYRATPLGLQLRSRSGRKADALRCQANG